MISDQLLWSFPHSSHLSPNCEQLPSCQYSSSEKSYYDSHSTTCKTGAVTFTSLCVWNSSNGIKNIIITNIILIIFSDRGESRSFSGQFWWFSPNVPCNLKPCQTAATSLLHVEAPRTQHRLLIYFHLFISLFSFFCPALLKSAPAHTGYCRPDMRSAREHWRQQASHQIYN